VQGLSPEIGAAAGDALNRLHTMSFKATVLALGLLALGGAARAADEPLLEYTVSARDTLISLSSSVFASPAAWREIAALNKLPDANRIFPGQVLRVPARLMRFKPAAAKLVSVTGDVRVGDAPVAVGGTLNEGQSLQTGESGSAVVELADGSRLRLPPSSLAEVVASRHYGAQDGSDPARSASTGWFSGVLRLVRGSVEVFATKVLRAKPLEVTTPTAVVGVRGTQYRVSFEEAANGSTRTEVLEGRVRFDAASAASNGADVAAGFGAAIDTAAAPPNVVKLPVAPDLSAVPERFERPLIRFQLPAETVAVRVQVAADEAFDQIVSDQRVAAGTDIRIGGLADARWYLRARRLDAQGIEGYDAQRAFVLKARPEPPASNTPRVNAKQTVGEVAFSWAPNVESRSVRLQVAREASFAAPLLLDQAGITANTANSNFAEEGNYFWRMASVRADGDQGPFGDPQAFELRPLPTPPEGGVAPDGKSLVLSWSGRPQDKQQVELASDPEFKSIVAKDQLDKPEWAVPTPSRAGLYYFRYRSIEPDGFVSPNSQALKIEVPRDWRWLWLFTPLLFL
jgi:hypothetical protein